MKSILLFACSFLKQSLCVCHFFISDAIRWNIDVIILAKLVGEIEVGNYSAASKHEVAYIIFLLALKTFSTGDISLLRKLFGGEQDLALSKTKL